MKKIIIIIFFSLGFLLLSQISSMVASKHPYPPCLDCTCTGNYCKQPGETVPYEWSELIGTEIHKAKVIVERTNPNVTAVVLLEVSCIHIFDVCCNRVWLCPDGDGRVRIKPIVG
ncbi:hypothetical protein P3S67_003056 [Capsicum chacoense]